MTLDGFLKVLNQANSVVDKRHKNHWMLIPWSSRKHSTDSRQLIRWATNNKRTLITPISLVAHKLFNTGLFSRNYIEDLVLAQRSGLPDELALQIMDATDDHENYPILRQMLLIATGLQKIK